MKVAFVVREVMPDGGLTLATFRLATALHERGHEATVLYTGGEPPPDLSPLARPIAGDPDGPDWPDALRALLGRFAPDLVVVGSGQPSDLLCGLEVAPTLLHGHLHLGTCPDEARYWSRLEKDCSIRAGWRCAAVRPVLGCSDIHRSLRIQPIRAQRSLRRILEREGCGVLCVSTEQARIYSSHGVPQTQMSVVPNLGVRMDAKQLAAASEATPEAWRSAVAFVGRLSKPKGAHLLPDLVDSLGPGSRFRVFGDGYLRGRLASLPGDVLCGSISQEQVAGVLMWARAVAFPSLWPEPGGIVGVDAQIMGVPLAAFDVGASKDWPNAELFSPGDVTSMGAWLGAQGPIVSARDPEHVAAAQRAYWRSVARQAEKAFESFADFLTFEPEPEGPAEALLSGARPQGDAAAASAR